MSFRSILLTFVVFAGFSADQPARSQPLSPEIEWEVAHRFRLFRDEAHFREILRLYQALPLAERQSEPAMKLELALEKASAEETLAPVFGQKWEIEHFGWSARLFQQTCFIPGNRDHYQCRLLAKDANGKTLTTPGERFMNPVAADILVRLKPGATPLPAGNCLWSAGSASATAPCNGTARIKGLAYDADFTIEVKQASGAPVTKLGTAQRARHLFIAGLGDSFASGEGNPDRPVFLNGQQTPVDYIRSSPLPDGSGARHYPVRIGNNQYQTGGVGQPYWLNAQCHRSLYSQQVKAALGLALEQPHVAVSFTGYACTGASVHQGILDFWEGRDDVGEASYDAAPQLMRLLRDYCADPKPYRVFESDSAPGFTWSAMKRCQTWRQRPPDIVLLSIGGNDVGFARVIAGQIFGNTSAKMPANWKFAEKIWIQAADTQTFEQAEEMVKTLFPGNLIELRKALDYHLRPKPGEDAAFRVIQTGYPHLTRTKSGTCRAGDDGMDVHAVFSLHKDSGKKGQEFVDFFNGRLKSAVASLGHPRWSFTDEHADRFAGHAYCQPGAPTKAEFTAKNYDPVQSGSLDFPLFNTKSSRWTNFQPENWRAYRPRERWFVNPNDGFQTGHYLSSDFIATNAQSDRAQPIIASTFSGAFHPNALGNAAIADAVIPELRKALGLAAPVK